VYVAVPRSSLCMCMYPFRVATNPPTHTHKRTRLAIAHHRPSSPSSQQQQQEWLGSPLKRHSLFACCLAHISDLPTMQALRRAAISLVRTRLTSAPTLARTTSLSHLRHGSSSSSSSSTSTTTEKPVAKAPRAPREGTETRLVVAELKHRLASFRVAGISLGIFVLILALPVLLWPVFDLLLFPCACRKAIARRKFDDGCHTSCSLSREVDAADAIEQLRQIIASHERQVVCLTGPEASEFARHFVREQRFCGYIDYRRIFDMNPHVRA